MATPDFSSNPHIQALEESLQAARAERDAARRELDDLARYLSHDLRAPLRGIDGYSKALIEDYGEQLDPLALSYLHFISDSGKLAADVLDKLIHYIRVPRAALNPEPVDLSAAAEETIARLEQRAAAAHSGAPRAIRWQVAPGLAALADERLARLLLEILLDNACKFTARCPQAEVLFAARETGGETAFIVQDNGAGFDPAYAGSLFQPFQRLHSAHEFEGAGMGLALARRIVERHGGRIWAHGAVDRGATFWFSLRKEEHEISEIDEKREPG